ncbi:MAG: hypothetical protein A2750_00730 [Candidatus Yanofskybacteria bacterium RIFCSPHIGHO2_01_FULL_45_42]|uniref:Uncharacterized protein n=3 Tax=Candidatus Yanofskyibacteriota TaxID=1752733 RepID=A0A1F8F589_9BACT|nr:MAG: hypothetical protein A2750_00730 [Candidatus Yanofskybacteria bacterium RIFCSPHIGHO2_01_FULL_45_42]OGN16358.1 MAG: hypothetical protein A3C81_02760 [Candidatus Yanofskybacteria bacterium RIFCSPHIGHO2_02_FULL_46_19]OGN26984.1 MAG: hypothetical protein A3B17_03070 [Candidatus Yanofskybacteria bacterium RIFCSPLOWO2_01_FULL_45_72]OGN32391.1 MAG: hypothetical protein A3J01_00520 [Candidatus Yanofskybacteria bacterium RIFCSPLOWO2_02_FULL_45_18]
MTATRSWEIIKVAVFIILACLIIYWAVPRILAIGILSGANLIDRVFNFNLSAAIKARANTYPFLYFRPELFVILASHESWPAVEIFLTYWSFTTLMTVLTWLGTAGGQKLFKQTSLADKLAGIVDRWLKFLISHYGRYIIFIPFIFPVIPGIDTASVVAGKLLKINFWIFIAVNSAKAALILCFA